MKCGHNDRLPGLSNGCHTLFSGGGHSTAERAVSGLCGLCSNRRARPKVFGDFSSDAPLELSGMMFLRIVETVGGNASTRLARHPLEKRRSVTAFWKLASPDFLKTTLYSRLRLVSTSGESVDFVFRQHAVVDAELVQQALEGVSAVDTAINREALVDAQFK